MNIDFDLIEDMKEKILKIYEDSKKIKNIDVENKEGNDIVTAIDLYMEKNIIFVKEAGGKITNLKGNNRDKIDTLLVTNGNIHNEIVEILHWNK